VITTVLEVRVDAVRVRLVEGAEENYTVIVDVNETTCFVAPRGTDLDVAWVAFEKAVRSIERDMEAKRESVP